MKSTAAALILGVGLVACGGDSGTKPTPTPSVPTYVSVGGNYVGTVTVKFTGTGQSLVCSATTTANQSQDYVIFSVLTLSGPAPCGSLSTPLNPLVIDTTGKVPSYPQRIAVTDTCGDQTLTIDGGFSGNELLLSYTFTTTRGTCVGLSYTIKLTKQ
jgi:hypothetical protein